MTRVAIDHLRDALTARGRELGFDQPRAERLADHFLDAEMRGARGHGAERMRWLHGLGDLRPQAAPLLRERSDGLARYDGDGALGYLALAEVLADELADPPAGRAADRRRRLLPHRPARLLRRAGRRRRPADARHRHLHPSHRASRRAARRCSARTRCAWACPAGLPR